MLRALRCFSRVAELGSFTAAAREAGMTQPSVSKLITGLERELGVRLIERTTTSLMLTEEGRQFYRRGKAMLEEFSEAVAEVRGQTSRAVGALVVSAPVGLGELRLNRLALDFLAAYPDIELELILSDRAVDLVEDGVDLAIRLTEELPPNVIARRLGTAPRLLVAAPRYLEARPPIERPEDIEQHDYIRFAGIRALERVDFTRDGETVRVTPRGRYRINSSLALRDCFAAGTGLGSAPAWVVQDLVDSGDLVRLLPDWAIASQPLYVVYPTRRYLPHRTRLLLEFLAERLPRLPGFA